MQTTLRVLFWLVALGVTTAVAQTREGEIAGRIRDKSGAPLPGVRISITNGDQRAEGVTDVDGRFVVRSLTMGAHRVVAEIPGFTPTSGEIRLSPSRPRASLAWSMEVGCLAEILVISGGARDTARSADAILHVRVLSTDGPVQVSIRPECPPQIFHEYSVHVLDRARGRGAPVPEPGQIFTSERVQLEADQEYLVFLWPEEFATRSVSDLILPISSGAVTSSTEQQLNGMRVDEALRLLGKWSREKQR